MRGYHFTERVRQALVAAREEAGNRRHAYVGTEHLLLGLLVCARRDEPLGQMLSANGLAPTHLQAGVDTTVPTGDVHRAEPLPVDLPYTSRAKRVLELSMNEASALRAAAVDVEHLLLGLLAEQRGVAARVLTDAGANLTALRDYVRRVQSTDGRTRVGAAGRLANWIRNRVWARTRR